ncbi:hypothetical protein [Paenibacillus glycanilyticus]|uniref:Uncharacterized protein n=1 Tax=Paenibacillus glycanilyticus TaxID=126569 RepID=A0ABQ6G8K9_9BACL|nr:hypothetical protein [Paenibacillus glycanilyticus]GLX67309.1 hypothetical protein MU1_16540 [Paenibacillus glycanilyticus]
MAINRKLFTDPDFEEAVLRKYPVRVFQDDYIVNNGGTVIRFDDSIVVIQSSVSDLVYYNRSDCEFFEVRKR